MNSSCRWLAGLSIAALPLFVNLACGGGGGGSVLDPVPVQDFHLTASGLGAVPAGGGGTLVLAATRIGGHTTAIALSLVANAQGITATPSSIPAGQGNGTLPLTVPSNVAPGTYSLTIQGTDGVLTRQASFSLTVTSAQNAPTISSFAPGSGPVGTLVTLSGSRFLAVTGLRFGSTAAEFSVNAQGTELTTHVPSGAATGRIILVYPEGTAQTATDFVVTQPSVSVLVDPRTATVAAGAQATFAAQVTGSSNTSVTWSVVEPGGGAINPQGRYTAPQTAGTYHVRATSQADPSRNDEATVTVTGGGASGATVSWSVCPDGEYVWAAWQDGQGPWQRLLGTNHAYSFTVTNPEKLFSLAVAFQAPDGEVLVRIYHAASDEAFLHGFLTDCVGSGTPAGVSVQGTVTGYSEATEMASVSFGGGAAVNAGAYRVEPVAIPGTYDFAAWKSTRLVPFGTSISTRAILRRGIQLATGAPDPTNLAGADLGGAESFALSAHTATLTGLDPQEQVFGAATFSTQNGSSINLTGMALPAPGQTTIAFAGVPVSKQVSGEMHLLTAAAMKQTGANSAEYRGAWTWFAAPADRTLALPPAMAPAVTVAAATAPQVRLRTDWPAALPYNMHFLNYRQSDCKVGWEVTLSPRWYQLMPKGTYTLPDLSGVAGWNGAWALQTGLEVTWSVNGQQWDSLQNWPPAEGALVRTAQSLGAVTP